MQKTEKWKIFLVITLIVLTVASIVIGIKNKNIKMADKEEVIEEELSSEALEQTNYNASSQSTATVKLSTAITVKDGSNTILPNSNYSIERNKKISIKINLKNNQERTARGIHVYIYGLSTPQETPDGSSVIASFTEDGGSNINIAAGGSKTFTWELDRIDYECIKIRVEGNNVENYEENYTFALPELPEIPKETHNIDLQVTTSCSISKDTPITVGTEAIFTVTIINRNEFAVENVRLKFYEREKTVTNGVVKNNPKAVVPQEWNGSSWIRPTTEGSDIIIDNIAAGSADSGRTITKVYKLSVRTPEIQIRSSSDTLASETNEIIKFALVNYGGTSGITVTNACENLDENPAGYAYKGDTLKGKIFIYNGNYDINSNYREPNLYYEGQTADYYTRLNTSISVPSGITIKNATCTHGGLSSGSNYINFSTNRFGRGGIAVISFEYTIEDGYSGSFSINPITTLYSDHYYVRREIDEQGHWERHGLSLVWVDTTYKNVMYDDKGRATGIPSTSFNLTVGQPNLVITSKSSPAEGQTVSEMQNLYLEYTIKNNGTAPATNVVLENTFSSDTYYISTTVTDSYGDTSHAYPAFDLESRKIRYEIGKIDQGKQITIKFLIRSSVIKNGQAAMNVESNANVSAKVVQTQTAPTASITVQQSPNLTKTQRDRLTEIDNLCALNKELRLLDQANMSDGITDKLFRPIMEMGYYTYCIRPGVGLPKTGYFRQYVRDRYEEATTEHTTCSHAPDVSNLDLASDIYFKCEGYHYTESSEYKEVHADSDGNLYETGKVYNNLYDVGFIASFEPSGKHEDKFSGQVQQALWMSPITHVPDDQTNKSKVAYRNSGYDLHNCAISYKEFYEKVMDTNNGQKVGLKAKSLIEYDTGYSGNTGNKTKMKVYNDTEEKLIKIGPFKLDYIDGSYEHMIGVDASYEAQARAEKEAAGESISTVSYAFSGISDMYLQDVNGKRINLVNIVKTNKYDENGNIEKSINQTIKVCYDEIENTFFSNCDYSTGEYNDNLMDWWAKRRTYPKPGEEFYVEISSEYDFNGDGVIDDKDYLSAALSLKVKFKYLHCEVGLCKRKPVQYYIYQDHICDPTGHKDIDYCGGCEDYEMDGIWDCPGHESWDEDCTKIPRWGERYNHQHGLYIVTKSRVFEEEELEVAFNTNTNVGGSGSGNPSNNNPYINTSIKIGGYVFQDSVLGKESQYDGKNTNQDLKLANIEVSLYEYDEKYYEQHKTHKLAVLKNLLDENPSGTLNGVPVISTANTEDKNDYTRRTNPTLTDENGYYEFRGVDPTKKYFVKFTYNGQNYIPTNYMVDCDLNSLNNTSSNYGETENWKQASKATEKNSERDAYNNRFASIGSSPNNYITTNSLRIDQEINNLAKNNEGNYYNETFTEYQLVGISLDKNGNYQYDSKYQLVDTYYEVKNGQVTSLSIDPSAKVKPGLITVAIRNYIDNKDINGNPIPDSHTYNNKEHKYPDSDAMRNYIYKQIVSKVGNSEETWKKLQFIEDCKINSYTKDINAEELKDYVAYPYQKYYTIYVEKGLTYPNNSYATYTPTSNIYPSKTYSANSGNVYKDLIYKGTTDEPRAARKYMNVYPSILFINQGLVTRNKFDVSLKKDLYKTTLKINGKTQTYSYDNRSGISELQEVGRQYGINSDEYLAKKLEIENRYWDIQERIKYAGYYDSVYNRGLYESDFYYLDNNKLEAYVTYKITIRNQSQTMLAQIDEVVDYYDNTLELEEDKSWVMYKDDASDSNNKILVRDQDFYDIMVGDLGVTGDKYRRASYNNFASHYESNTQYDSEFSRNGYNTLYVDGIKGKKLGSGESAYVYLTFKVKGEGSNLNLSSATTENTKQNIAEINGYSSFYAHNTKLPNNVVKYSNDAAGKVDWDSNPGNLRAQDLRKESGKYEHNFEDDTDRARGLRFSLEYDDEGNPITRTISGNVWEDKREVTSDGTDAIIGNGIREDDKETHIQNILVELLEVDLQKNGTKWKYEYDENSGDIKLRTDHTLFYKEEGQEMQTQKVNTQGITLLYSPEKSESGRIIKNKLARTLTDENGNYSFTGIVPGDYIVRFTYGGTYEEYMIKVGDNLIKNDTFEDKIISPKTQFYNGQDYKSTTYQKGINQGSKGSPVRTDMSKNTDPGYYGYTDYGTYGRVDNKITGQNASGSYGYDIYAADNNANVSDAKDLWAKREEVNAYSSDNYSGVTYDLANRLDDNLTPNDHTQMIAETGVIRFEMEYNRQTSNGDDTATNGNGNSSYRGNNYKNGTAQNVSIVYAGGNDKNGKYHVENVDLGLEERPKSQLELDQKVSNIKVVLANGTVLFDANKSADNLIWKQRREFNVNDFKGKSSGEAKHNIYSTYYKSATETSSDMYKKLRQEIAENNVNSRTINGSNKGLLQITMDNELMHGATIQITYDFKVTNIGEEDYKETTFYYTGKVANKNTLVKTSADTVIDYVSNNLQFRTGSNKEEWEWKAINRTQISNEEDSKNHRVTDGDENGKGYLKDSGEGDNIYKIAIENHNTIIRTRALGRRTESGNAPSASESSRYAKAALAPVTKNRKDDSTYIETKLVLTQQITPQNTMDDLSYENIAELVEYSNDVGRRMAFTVVGNQNPVDKGNPSEIDTPPSEEVIILPPFGQSNVFIYLSIVVATLALLGSGIVVIKKTIINKRK